MKNGDKTRKNLAEHLTKKMGGPSAARDKQRRGSDASVRPSSRDGRQDPVPDLLNNPLYLASDIQPPDFFQPPYFPPIQEGIPGGDIQIDVDSPQYPSGLPPITRRSSHGSFSTVIDDLFKEPEPDSPHTSYQDEIAEEPDMNEVESPINVVDLNVIGAHTPPRGYVNKEEPIMQRIFKEIHRVWIAPALAGVPAFLDNWWKTRRAGHQGGRLKPDGKGVGAAIQGIQEGTWSLTPDQAFSARIAGWFVLSLITALLIYTYLERRKRNYEVVYDTSKDNMARNRVVTYIPKEKYLLDRARQARENAQRQALQEERSNPPASQGIPYEYPPAYTYSSRQRRLTNYAD